MFSCCQQMNRPHSFFVAQPLWKECTDCVYWLNTTLQAGWPDYDSSIHDNCQIEPWVKKNTETGPQRGEPQRWLSVEGVLFHWHHDLKSPFHFPTVTACWFQRWLCVPKWSGSFLVHFSSAAATTAATVSQDRLSKIGKPITTVISFPCCWTHSSIRVTISASFWNQSG